MGSASSSLAPCGSSGKYRCEDLWLKAGDWGMGSSIEVTQRNFVERCSDELIYVDCSKACFHYLNPFIEMRRIDQSLMF